MLTFKIYTARYQNQHLPTSGLAPVRITLGPPRMRLPYQLAGEVRDLAPTGALFHIHTRVRFEPKFHERLDQVGAERILPQLDAIHQRTGKDLVLLCFERVDIPGEWCHRLCVASWFQARLGITLEELAEADAPPPPKVRKRKRAKLKEVADSKSHCVRSTKRRTP